MTSTQIRLWHEVRRAWWEENDSNLARRVTTRCGIYRHHADVFGHSPPLDGDWCSRCYPDSKPITSALVKTPAQLMALGRPMTEREAPATAAGRVFLEEAEDCLYDWTGRAGDVRRAIRAIEAEAKASGRTRIRYEQARPLIVGDFPDDKAEASVPAAPLTAEALHWAMYGAHATVHETCQCLDILARLPTAPAASQPDEALLEWAEGAEDGSGCRWCSFSEGHIEGCLVAEARAALTRPASQPDEALRAAATSWHDALRDGHLRSASCACARGTGEMCTLGAVLAARSAKEEG